MYTKKQMEQWVAWGFPFSVEDQALAVENDNFLDPNIVNLWVENAEKPVAGALQTFQVVVVTSHSIQTNETTIEVELDGKTFVGTYTYKKGMFNFLQYRLAVSVLLPPPYSSYVYSLQASTVSVLGFDKGRIISSKSIVIEVEDTGKVAVTDKQLPTKGKSVSVNGITIVEVDQIFPLADENIQQQIVDSFNEGADFFQIDNCLRKAHFFAQALKEVGSDFGLKQGENLNYPADGLKNGFWLKSGTRWVDGDIEKQTGGYFQFPLNKESRRTINLSVFKKNPELAEQYGRKDYKKYLDHKVQRANPEMLANYAYAHKIGNGAADTGDGYRFRGRGMIQLTGRTNYTGAQTELTKFDKTIDIITDPDVISTDVRLAVLSAMAYWKARNVNRVIKRGKSDKEAVDKVTNLVNPGEDPDNKSRRVKAFQITKVVFDIENCEV